MKTTDTAAMVSVLSYKNLNIDFIRLQTVTVDMVLEVVMVDRIILQAIGVHLVAIPHTHLKIVSTSFHHRTVATAMALEEDMEEEMISVDHPEMISVAMKGPVMTTIAEVEEVVVVTIMEDVMGMEEEVDEAGEREIGTELHHKTMNPAAPALGELDQRHHLRVASMMINHGAIDRGHIQIISRTDIIIMKIVVKTFAMQVKLMSTLLAMGQGDLMIITTHHLSVNELLAVQPIPIPVHPKLACSF